MQNEEKSKRKYHAKSLKDVKAEEDKDWTNCHEIEGEKSKWSLLPWEIQNSVRMANRGLKNRIFLSTKTKVALFILATVCTVLFAFLIHQLTHADLAYAFNHEAKIYREMCGDIPLQEQGENCSILLAKVLQK